MADEEDVQEGSEVESAKEDCGACEYLGEVSMPPSALSSSESSGTAGELMTESGRGEAVPAPMRLRAGNIVVNQESVFDTAKLLRLAKLKDQDRANKAGALAGP